MKIAALAITLLSAVSAIMPVTTAAAMGAGESEAEALQSQLAAEAGRPAYSLGHGVSFKPSDHVFIKSALAVDFAYRKASVTLPLSRGLSPAGKDVSFIITDASEF